MAETNWTNVSFPHGLVSLANGQVAVLWSQVNDVSRCRVQLFRADGRKLGHETILKGVNLSQFNYPYLSALPDGGFVAAWQVALPDGQSRAIGGQRFNHLGRPIGERFLVNDPTVHLFPEINITPLMDGRFVVGWIEANRLTDSVEQPDLERIWEIRGQILDGRATPIRVQGSQGDDDVLGTRFADHLFGAAGNDQLAGGAGSDRLDGGLGDDRLIGGPGTDRLRGGAGQDLFVFQAGDLGPRVWDTIVDFTPGSDRIDLGALDADLSQPGQQSFTLLPFPIDGGPKRRGFTAPGQLLYDPSTGVLSGNVNDSPHPDVQILLSQRPLLQPGDLLL
ncbi:MAG: M10 family metallopeptidase C-terminal domain-containing protein [Cyanobacteriota bacterium]